MSDDASARLNLPYLAAGQLQKHVTLNEALTRLDALIQTAVVSRTLAVEPTAADDGALYILPEGATGADWAGRAAGTLMRAEAGGWRLVEAPDGLLAVVLDSQEVLVRRGGTWAPLPLGEKVLQQLTRLGLNTDADAANVFAARLNKALWTALESESGGDGDLRFTFNKQGAGDVLSLLFQSGWGGRAELGLIGDDDLRLKVSADGGTWRDVFAVDRTTGRMWLPQGAMRREAVAMTLNGDWVPPVWAQWVQATCVGGGGGGGLGAYGPSGTARHGGGGGGAGGVTAAVWPIAAVADGLSVVIGQGGASGVVGGESTITVEGVRFLTGEGGQAGAAGAALGAGGAGGGGLVRANAGGAASVGGGAGAGRAEDRPDGSGGGGAGGGVSTADAAHAGGAGGIGGLLHLRAEGGAGSAGAGGDGRDAPAVDIGFAGGGGAGGGASGSGAGHRGGDGGLYGAGGGGGGAGLIAGGLGGSGAAGVVLLTAIG